MDGAYDRVLAPLGVTNQPVAHVVEESGRLCAAIDTQPQRAAALAVASGGAYLRSQPDGFAEHVVCRKALCESGEAGNRGLPRAVRTLRGICTARDSIGCARARVAPGNEWFDSGCRGVEHRKRRRD